VHGGLAGCRTCSVAPGPCAGIECAISERGSLMRRRCRARLRWTGERVHRRSQPGVFGELQKYLENPAERVDR